MNQKGSSQSYFLAFALMAIALGLAYFAFQKDEGESKLSSKAPPSISANSPEAEKIVNKYLKETNKAIEMQQLDSKIKNQFVVPKVGEVISTQTEGQRKNTIKIRETDELHAVQNAYDLDSPAAQVQNELAEQQRLAAYDQKFKQEYIRQFIENARKNGWRLVVDENGVIKSATQINQEEKQHIFDGPSRLSNE